MENLNLTYNGTNIKIDKSKTILENIKHNNITTNFQCQKGNCGTCRCEVISGEFLYKNTPIAFILKIKF